MRVLVGIDLGTSAVKAAAFDCERLQPQAVATRTYPMGQPGPGLAEQDPETWWQAVQAVLVELTQGLSADIAAIGVAGQMHGWVGLDRRGAAVRPAILWADTRATREVDDLRGHWQTDPRQMPGPPAVGFAAASALWLWRHEPQTLERTAVWMAPKDYIVFRLTGRLGSEPSDASASWLYAVSQASWSAAVMEACGLSRGQMPPLAAPQAVVGTVSPAVAARLGLRLGVPVVAGCADLTAQALGQGVVDPGACLIVVGTGGQVVVPRLTPAPDPAGRFYVFTHCQPQRWYAQAAILAAGLALTWLRERVGGAEAADLIDQASTVPAGADGLVFLPYLVGERSPHLDPLASGAWIGLRLHHTRAHLVRAVLEGVAFALKDCLQAIAAEEAGPGSAVISGGLTRSPAWCQLLADVLELPLRQREVDLEAGCLGAALLAGQGVGVWAPKSGAPGAASDWLVYEPRLSTVYRDRYAQYRSLYPVLREPMHRLVRGV